MTTVSQLGNNYQNPLDNFRSYSYNFVMVAGPSSDSISQMVGNGKGKSPLFSLVNGVGLGDKIQLNETEAYLILDTRRFSSYSISSLDMVHSFGTGNPNNPTVPYAAHTLKVYHPPSS